MNLNPAYHKNRECTGRFIEFIREDDSGINVSHNFIKIRDDYFYSFALLFIRSPTQTLYHSLLAGSRFDSGRTVLNQFNEDLEIARGDNDYPERLWSSGAWRSNTIELLTDSLSASEQRLLPFYRGILSSGKSHLIGLFETAQNMFEGLPDAISIEEVTENLSDLKKQHDQWHRECHSLSAFKIARGGFCEYAYGPPTPGFKINDIPREIIVFSQLPVFFSERNRLSEIIAITERL